MSQRLFHWFSLLTLAVGVLLIWWGAAVTTEDVGLAVPDWPLCYGRLNPEGWWRVPALLLEHGHRWIGATIGMLVLIQYVWQWKACRGGVVELAGLLLCAPGFLVLVHQGALVLAAGFAGIGLLWLVMSWISQKWPLLRGLTTLALLLVVIQASLGGLRVLKMSDPFGIVHGCLGQLFFCVLVFVSFVSSPTWRHGRLILPTRSWTAARVGTLVVWLAVFCQLVFGAVLRHTQRDHLAASDILTTKGQWIPPVVPSDVFMLFLHKYWGFAVACLVVVTALRARRWLQGVPRLENLPLLLLFMPLVQVTLGVFVVLTGKSFWVTNFHVLNGLAMLALSFLLLISVWASSRTVGLVAGSNSGVESAPEADKRPSVA